MTIFHPFVNCLFLLFEFTLNFANKSSQSQTHTNIICLFNHKQSPVCHKRRRNEYVFGKEKLLTSAIIGIRSNAGSQTISCQVIDSGVLPKKLKLRKKLEACPMLCQIVPSFKATSLRQENQEYLFRYRYLYYTDFQSQVLIYRT